MRLAGDLRHAEIILQQIQHPDFSKTTQDFQDGLKETFRMHLRNARHDVYLKGTKEEVQRFRNLQWSAKYIDNS